jgi:sulfhydrogenase subunit beta (sulfur reductase)
VMATMGDKLVIDREGLDRLFAELAAEGRTIVGPTLRDGAIVLGEILGVGELPAGWTERQDAGRYRLEQRRDDALFGYVAGPHSFKPWFFPPRETLFRVERRDRGFEPVAAEREAAAGASRKLALIGARSCDLHALAIQDRDFSDGPFVDDGWLRRRRDVFVVAVHCGEAGGTCFCVSMGTGPRATSGYDLALTELLEGEHRFLLDIGSDAGLRVAARLPSRKASSTDTAEAERATANAVAGMGRRMETSGIKELLYANLEHPQWDRVAERCLACANCTMVCPTCFCSSVEDVTDLDGSYAERVRRWDSCFTAEHSYVHGGPVHASIRSRYRQWLTHKLASWQDQFGTSGCVGCGRCVTWCPPGIDLTEEIAAIRGAGG